MSSFGISGKEVVVSAEQPSLYYATCFVVSFLGCYVVTQLTEQLRVLKRQPSQVLGHFSVIVLLAFSFGGVSVWIMHLISLATMKFTLPDGSRVSKSFAIGFGALSFGIAIVGNGIGTYIASRDSWFYKSKVEIAELMTDQSKDLTLREIRKSTKLIRIMLTKRLFPILCGGIVTGVSAAAMHYLGTVSLVFPGRLEYNPGVVACSAVIAVIGATVAYWILFRFLALYPERELYRVMSAAVMAVALCGMHFTGCAGTTLVYTGVEQKTLTIQVSSEATVVSSVLVGLAFLWIIVMILVSDLRSYFYSRVAIINSIDSLLKQTAEAAAVAGNNQVSITGLMERFVVIKEKYAVQRSFSGAQESTSAQGPVSWMERVVGKVIGSPSPMSRRDSKRGSMVMSALGIIGRNSEAPGGPSSRSRVSARFANSSPPGINTPGPLGLAGPSGPSSRNNSARINSRLSNPKASPHPADAHRNRTNPPNPTTPTPAGGAPGVGAPGVGAPGVGMPYPGGIQVQDSLGSMSSIPSNLPRPYASRNSKASLRNKGSPGRMSMGSDKDNPEVKSDKRNSHSIGSAGSDNRGSDKGGGGRRRSIVESVGSVGNRSVIGNESVDLEAGRAGGGGGRSVKSNKGHSSKKQNSQKQSSQKQGHPRGSDKTNDRRSAEEVAAAVSRTNSARIAKAMSKSEIDRIGCDV